MPEHFYDKVTRKFGTFSAVPHPIADYPDGNPEAIFEQKLLELSGQDKTALDIGCGDGRFTLRMASHFREIIGIDTSEERLKLAQTARQAQGCENVRFEMQNAQHTTFAQNTFDVLYNRRGPTWYHEFYRITRPEGYFVMIGIGEKDAWELKQIFGRGQGFWKWKTTALDQATEQLSQEGFVRTFGQSFLYDEYFASYQNLDIFLQGVPIFEDFDLEKDRKHLEQYVAKFQKAKGILLPRHRYVIVCIKP